MNSESNAAEPQRSEQIEAIRKNVPMYIGSVNFFGFVQYLVSAFDLLLQNRATWIEIEIKDGDEIRLSSDAQIPLRVNRDGLLEPFEAFGELKLRHLPDATILTALSAQFALVATDGSLETRLKCRHGARQSFQQRAVAASGLSVQLDFSPDYAIFSVTEISPAALHSYCRRTACLYPGVSFRVKSESDVAEYRSERGIQDFFAAISLPYQLLHTPIHLLEAEDNLKVEAVFTLHSWSENRIWSFANKGRVPDGGTHEAGMLDAIAILRNASNSTASAGILAVLAVEYPHITFEGCIKARIGNPELRDKVAALLSRGLNKWLAKNEDETERISVIETFKFADSW